MKALVLALLWVLPSIFPADNVSLTVTITDIPSSKGVIRVAVFNQADGFPDENKKAYRILSFPAQKGSLSFTLDSLTLGETIAISLLQDENKNGKLDTNMLGVPQEPYGTSNNPSPWRKPSFYEAKLTVKNNAPPVVIVMKELM
ncbi:DUF2141 domain-containing protein [Cytophagales bacterium LB-30]|uniref:DUF2141 domain-containing protein n=1 Tax=Shiella aurantiaca TaxID=3058365 RepID=A0ABT8F5V7_9BACT|nr:DUF2141 domain-containing protein [Shiella aurantiaca]MDN4165351.1 DUF2141 domain-containing protein [Shiella aurantiaca]